MANWKNWATALAIGAACAGPVIAQTTTPDKLIEQAKQKQLLTETKLESDTAEAIRSGLAVAKVDPSKAVRNLKDSLKTVNIAAGIGDAKRDELSKKVEAAIASIQKADKPAEPTLDPKVIARMEKGSKAAEALALETKEVREAIDAIAKDIDDKKDKDAKQKLAAITLKYPHNAAVVTLAIQFGSAESIAVAKDLSKLSAERYVTAMNDVQISALPAKGDIEFDKNYKARMKLRRELNAPRLSAEEKKLLEALDTPIKNGLKGSSFEEAIQLLSTGIGQKIYLDEKSLETAGVNFADKVDVPGGVKARSALRLMLQSKGLTFILRENIIQVIEIEKAKTYCVTRAYDVRDIVSVGGPFNGPSVWGPYMDAQQTAANAQMIIDAIKSSIDPNVWKDQGGPATITFNYATMSLIVRAPSETHADLYRKMNP